MPHSVYIIEFFWRQMKQLRCQGKMKYQRRAKVHEFLTPLLKAKDHFEGYLS